ncbi:MAG: VWA domain-containing protein [Gammaproteobacteria bacterium]
MRRQRRPLSAFSLSFLDIMSCGFGAVVLLFLIIKHQTDVAVAVPPYDLGVELEALGADLAAARDRVEVLRAAAADATRELEAASTARASAMAALEEARAPGNTDTRSRAAAIAKLRASIRQTELDKRGLEAQIHAKSRAVRRFVGEGNREYLTGIQLGGKRILVLLDASASMLDERIVNVIRKRNMDAATRRGAPKWQQALATVDWISARFPPDARFQIYTYAATARPALAGSAGQWLAVADRARLDAAVAATRERIPDGGSSLARALAVIGELDPPPDNVYLVTDGLPTLGMEPPRGTTIDGAARLRLFEQAVTRIPAGIPVNVILLPMEGDPMAPAAYWQIALYTRGAFLSPASDWP